MPKKWIQKALKKRKEGSLHRQLDVPQSKTIPKTLLNEIKSTPVGEKVHNPTLVGKKIVKVTGLLKKRAVLAKTLRKMRK